ncbi:MAG: HAD family hydrolase [Bacteroidota bacterium]
MGHLYVSDLDGTLLHRNVSVSERTRRQLRELLEQGLLFTIATARSIVSIREILEGIPISLPVVGGNGAYLSDFKTGEHILFRDISSTLSQEIFQYLDHNDFPYFVSAVTNGEDRLFFDRISNEAGSLFLRERFRIGDPRLRYCANMGVKDLGKIITISVPERPEVCLSIKNRLEAILPDQLEIHIYEDAKPEGWHWMSIHDKRATKANGISTIMEDYGFSPMELTVFGDNTNDLSMFQMAPRSVAVENARSQVKAFATHVIGHHESDSVINFIQEDWNKNQKGQRKASSTLARKYFSIYFHNLI